MKRVWILLAVFTLGCAGFQKNCAQFNAGTFGSDWIVVQYRADGTAFHCWRLSGASVGSSEGGNIDWQDPTNGHLVHITGWENRIQVQRKDFESAGRLLGIDATACRGGIYPAK